MKSNNFSFSNIVSVCLLLISLTAAFFAVSRTFRVKAVAKAEANASVDVQKQYVTKNIEDIRIGERTLGTNPQGRVDDELDDSIFETVPFCKYSLRTAKEDGSQCDIQLLRPANWLDDEITRLRRKIDGKVVDEVDLLADSLLLGELNSSDGYDGKRVQLHHLLQEEPGSLAEISQTLHSKLPHKLRGRGQSFRNNPELDLQYRDYREKYWMERIRQWEEIQKLEKITR